MFGQRRTDFGKGEKFQGVETPSQSRFVGYYETILYKFGGALPEKKVLKLDKIIINTIKGRYYFSRFDLINSLFVVGIGNSNGSDFSFVVYYEGKKEASQCNLGNDTNCKVKYFLSRSVYNADKFFIFFKENF
jgi:PTEN phosphatase family protein